MKRKGQIILSIVFLLLFILIASNLNNPSIKSIDQTISQLALNNQNNFLFTISKIISSIFEPAIIIPTILLVCLAFIIKKKRKFEKQLFFTSIIAGILIYSLKFILAVSRPTTQLITVTQSSFPSGHALMSFVLFSFLIVFYLNSKKSKSIKITITTLSIISILIVGLSRIYLNVHWFSDIVGSWFLGASIILISKIFFKD